MLARLTFSIGLHNKNWCQKGTNIQKLAKSWAGAYTIHMTKHAVMTILGVAIVVVAVGGFPAWVRTTLLVAGGLAISVLSYLSSVVYCSNCKKLIDNAEQTLPTAPEENIVNTKKIQ